MSVGRFPSRSESPSSVQRVLSRGWCPRPAPWSCWAAAQRPWGIRQLSPAAQSACAERTSPAGCARGIRGEPWASMLHPCCSCPEAAESCRLPPLKQSTGGREVPSLVSPLLKGGSWGWGPRCCPGSCPPPEVGASPDAVEGWGRQGCRGATLGLVLDPSRGPMVMPVPPYGSKAGSGRPSSHRALGKLGLHPPAPPCTPLAPCCRPSSRHRRLPSIGPRLLSCRGALRHVSSAASSPSRGP